MDELLEQDERREVLRRLLREFGADLGERDAALLQERLVAERPRTLGELGERFGVGRERMRQLERRLIERLRGFLTHAISQGQAPTPTAREAHAPVRARRAGG